MNSVRKKIIFWMILPVLLVSCQCLPKENIAIPSVIPVQRAALLTVEIEDQYPDGVFLLIDEWGKVKINAVRMQEEIELLRIELSKFE